MTFNEHAKNTAIKANNTIKILKALTSTSWGKQKETLLATYKTIVRPIIEYASTIWSPIMSNTNLEKLQTTQNTALRIITGCTSDTNIQHLHNETETLPLPLHLKLHASQLWHKSQLVTHPLHELNHQQIPPRSKKQTIFTDNSYHALQAYTTPATNDTIKANLKHTHHQLVQLHLTSRKDNPIIAQKPPIINKSEETLTRKTRQILAQVGIDKSPILYHT